GGRAPALSYRDRKDRGGAPAAALPPSRRPDTSDLHPVRHSAASPEPGPRAPHRRAREAGRPQRGGPTRGHTDRGPARPVPPAAGPIAHDARDPSAPAHGGPPPGIPPERAHDRDRRGTRARRLGPGGAALDHARAAR